MVTGWSNSNTMLSDKLTLSDVAEKRSIGERSIGDE
jgi:hypothetical protein